MLSNPGTDLRCLCRSSHRPAELFKSLLSGALRDPSDDCVTVSILKNIRRLPCRAEALLDLALSHDGKESSKQVLVNSSL
jgi:hypothetical protein